MTYTEFAVSKEHKRIYTLSENLIVEKQIKQYTKYPHTGTHAPATYYKHMPLIVFFTKLILYQYNNSSPSLGLSLLIF